MTRTREALRNSASPQALATARRPISSEYIRTPVRHLTLPFHEIARTDLIDGETLHALVQRTAWAVPLKIGRANAAVAIRGSAAALVMLVEHLSVATSFDELEVRVVELLHEGLDTVRKLTGDSDYGIDMQGFVAGWSETRGPHAFTVVTRHEPGVPAGIAIPIADLSIAPGDHDVHREAWQFLAGRTADDLDPRVDGLQLLEVQRRHRLTRVDGTRVFGIGGFGQLISIRRGSITSEILRHWPDKVGLPITPKAAA